MGIFDDGKYTNFGDDVVNCQLTSPELKFYKLSQFSKTLLLSIDNGLGFWTAGFYKFFI